MPTVPVCFLRNDNKYGSLMRPEGIAALRNDSGNRGDRDNAVLRLLLLCHHLLITWIKY